MIATELLATGSLSTRLFHGLLRGKTRHFLAPGSGWPVETTAQAPAITAMAATAARTRARMASQGRDRCGRLSRRAGRPIRRSMRLAATLAAAVALAVPTAARADVLLPPPGKVFAGVTGGYDTTSFERETGSHPAIFQFFTAWDGPMEYMFRDAEDARSRLMIHISTLHGSGREVITPRGIASGRGDGYLLKLNARMAES